MLNNLFLILGPLLLVATCIQAENGSIPENHYLKVSQEAEDKPWVACSEPTDGDSIYNYSIPYLNSSLGTLEFSKLQRKAILIVNVATFCQSNIEYPAFNQLKVDFGTLVEIVAIPSNQFLNQEPSSNPTEIFNAIKHVRPGNGFTPKFTLTVPVDVNGEKRDPIFSFLKRSCPSTRTRFSSDKNLLYAPKNARDIRWNFEKFLIHPTTGLPVKRYDQNYHADKIGDDIQKLLQQMVGF